MLIHSFNTDFTVGIYQMRSEINIEYTQAQTKPRAKHLTSNIHLTRPTDNEKEYHCVMTIFKFYFN